MKTRLQRFQEKLQPNGDCIEFVGAHNPKGYGHFWTGEKQVYAHRWAWEQANGPIPDGLCVLHSCDNPCCVSLTHLRLGTNVDNNRDKTERGKNVCGSEHGHAKLTEEQVIEIRRLHAQDGLLHREIAAVFGVCRETIGDIVRHNRWTHVTGEPHVQWYRGSHTLTEDQVLEIRRIYAQGGISQEKLGKQFGVGRASVSAIIHRQTWTHI